jgi:dihydroflavonol-4-reductase
MRALVTGASGFVGAAVARALVAQGWEVRALVRPASDRTNLKNLKVAIAVGDLAEAPSLAPALSGCEALFHVAADYRLGAPDPSQLYRTNVEGTRHLLSAAVQAGVKKIVYTSSVATMGIPVDGTPGDEGTPASLEAMIGHYKRSKYLAEQVVLEAAAAGTPAVIVNPSTPVGPGDVKPRPRASWCWTPRPAVCRPMSTPGSISCTSTMSRPVICWPFTVEKSVNATFSAART